MEAGYLSVEIEQLQLGTTQLLGEQYSIRIDVEITDTSDVLQWASTGDGKFSTSNFSPVLQEATEEGTPNASESEGTGEEEAPPPKVYDYIHGFSGTFLRSTYIDLDPQVMNGLANAAVQFKVMSINNSPPAAAPPPKKGQPPPEVEPAEEALFTLSMPIASVLGASNCFVQIDQTFDVLLSNSNGLGSAYMSANVAGDKSVLTLKICTDNDLAEYVIGSKIFRWQAACLTAPPPQWGLHAPDAVDPKAKVQPTAAEYRQKYLENISKLVEDHSGVASYSLSVGGSEVTETPAADATDGEPSSGDADAVGTGASDSSAADIGPVTAEIQRIFKSMTLLNGKVGFDRTAAEEVGEDEDIRAIGSLWSVTWEPSTVLFLHRSTVRRIITLLKEDPGAAYLPVTLKKTPSEACNEVEGGELTAIAYLSIEDIATPGSASAEIKATLEGESMVQVEAASAAAAAEGRAKTSFTITSSCSPSLVPPSAVDKFKQDAPPAPGAAHIPAGVLSENLTSSHDPNRDIVAELRKDISTTIERIAQEYVSLYPEPLPPPSKGHMAAGDGADNGSTGGDAVTPRGGASRGGSNASRAGSAASRVGSSSGSGGPGSGGQSKPLTKEDRQADFLDFLMSNGIFHDLKESLKPRIQSLIREQCGQRGRALNKSSTLRAADLGTTAASASAQDSSVAVSKSEEVTDDGVETVLSELYVFLLKECSLVLNSMFTDTIIDRDVEEFDKTAYVNDEQETLLQKNARLLRQAEDAAANGSFNIADLLLVERIQVVNHTSALGARPEIVHDAYADYARFLLQQCAVLLSNSPKVPTSFVQRAQSLQGKAREALKAAYDSMPDAWDVALLYAATLVESDQEEQGEYVLHDLIKTQLHKSNPTAGFDLEGFGHFDGYESDRLCPVQPDCYAVLAALFSMQGYPLKARKALLMANRSFAEGNFQPDVSSHGSPRRTIVLTLARTCIFLFKHSFVRLGHACLALAISSENAVTAKANARGKPAMTVPHIRCLLKQAQALAAMFDKHNTPASLSAAAAAGGGGGEMLVADQSAAESGFAGDAESAERIAQAVAMAQDGQLVAEAPEDVVKAWCTLAQTQNFASVEQWQVIDSYLNAIKASEAIPAEQLTAEKVVPLEAFVKAGKLLLLAGRYQETLTMLLYACKVYSSATLFMLLGVCCLRLDDLEDAEAALVEANILDNRSAEVWAYLSLVCVSGGPHRIMEAERSLDQALRLSLDNVTLLRELATSFMSVDKLQIAEDLIRRAITLETATTSEQDPAVIAGGSSGKRGNARTRKLLADVLAGQNQAAKAVDEYQSILADEKLEVSIKLEVADKCAGLLTTLGREEELAVLKNIISQLQSEQQQIQDASSPTNHDGDDNAGGGSVGAASTGSRPVMM